MKNNLLEKERQKIISAYVEQSLIDRKRYIEDCKIKGILPCSEFTGLPHDLSERSFSEKTYKRYKKTLGLK